MSASCVAAVLAIDGDPDVERCWGDSMVESVISTVWIVVGATLEGGAFKVERCGLDVATIGVVCVRNVVFAGDGAWAAGDAVWPNLKAPASL